MTTFYWIMEYGKVLVAYGILFYIWPSIIFRKFLKNKSLSFRIVFCVTEQLVLINTVVLLVGLFHCLNGYVIALLFYGPLVYLLGKAIVKRENLGKDLKRVTSGTYGVKNLIWRMCAKVRDRFRRLRKDVSMLLDGKKLEAVLLLVLILFGMIYFTYGAFQDYSYGFGDMYPHNAWIYGLKQGQIFSAGVYPEGMHCAIYAMSTLFGIRIYSCLLFFAGIHTSIFLFGAYLLLREIFAWRYTALLSLGLFLTLDMVCINEVYGMSRLQWTLPQETSLFTVFVCAAYLIRFAKGKVPEKPKEKVKFRLIKQIINDDNLLLFTLSLAVSIVMHFYCTIMAFFLCVALVPVLIFKLIKPKRLVPLVVAIMLGTFVAIIPMAGALLSGIPFQGSIGWAMNVMEGTDEEGGGNVILDENGQEITGNLFGGGNSSSQTTTDIDENGQEIVVESETPKLSMKERIDIIYRDAYVTLFKSDRARVIAIVSFVSLGLFVVLRLLRMLAKFVTKKSEIDAGRHDHYFSIVFASFIFMMMYCAPSLGIPVLIKDSRLCSVATMLIFSVLFIPVDALMSNLDKLLHRNVQKLLATGMLAAIYIGTRVTGNFHGYLYYELTRHNGAVMTTYKITKELPKYSFTIVSTVDELYQQIEYGYHEEVVNFVNECIESDYTIPTEYVFIYIEKHPLEYAQSHFFSGPEWLATEKYPKYYSSYVSQCPDITMAEISDDLAKPPFFVYPLSNYAYSDLPSRMVLESRLYYWCMEFSKLYPGELHTYYEDEDFVCYYFKQNPACLYQLGFQSGEEFEKQGNTLNDKKNN